jgi:Nuclear pore protein 84 / 107
MTQDTPVQSDQLIADKILNTDSDILQKIIIRNWLAETAVEFNPIEIQKGGYLFTLNNIRQKGRSLKPHSDLCTSLDPDGPSRQGNRLAPEDEVHKPNSALRIAPAQKRVPIHPTRAAPESNRPVSIL